MKAILSWMKHHYVARVGVSLIVVALIALMAGCGGVVKYNLTVASTAGGSVNTPGEASSTYDEGEVVNLVAEPEEGCCFVDWTGDVGTIDDVNDATTTITMEDDYSITATFALNQYDLTITSTEGGSVTTPGENAYTYDNGEVINLVAVADEGYQFVDWTGGVSTVADVNAASTTITMNSGYSITANFAKEIRDWYDLDAVRDNLGGTYILVNDLHSTTAGYAELASRMANGGKGWQPTGSLDYDTEESTSPFTGSVDGQGYRIRDLFINRPDEDGVGLFGCADEGGIIENLDVIDAEVTGRENVGGLVGAIRAGTVDISHYSGSVIGQAYVGGLVGQHWDGTLVDSHCTGSVTGDQNVGGLAGKIHQGIVNDSYFAGHVIGYGAVGGLVGWNQAGIISNSHYNYEEVLINGDNIITIGALFNEDFDQWLAADKFLAVGERLSQENGYYLISSVSDFKELLAFGQDSSLEFRLKDDLDLGTDANFYIPYLAAEFDGNGHEIANLTLSFDSVAHVGLFGYVDSGGRISRVGLENASISGGSGVGGLVGSNRGTVSDSYSSGSVSGGWAVGGLVGHTRGTLNDCYSAGRVTGDNSCGGLVGWYDTGTINNSHYDYDQVLINGDNIITIGALLNEDFDQWLTNDKFLAVDERLSQEDGYYLISSVSDFKELLAFGQDNSLKFRMKDDLDLDRETNFYIPYLAAEFDGNGHQIANLTLNLDSVSPVGLFGYVDSRGRISGVGVENTRISGDSSVGGLVGWNLGTVSNSYSTGSVTGRVYVGGLIGGNQDHTGAVSNSYSASSVSGGEWVGGLVGVNNRCTISKSYSAGPVSGNDYVGGLVGSSYGGVWGTGTATSSFWDTETSGMEVSDGGTGKTTAEMQDIATFTDAGWNIVAVAPGERNTAYIWNIVDGKAYPFLSWQPA